MKTKHMSEGERIIYIYILFSIWVCLYWIESSGNSNFLFYSWNFQSTVLFIVFIGSSDYKKKKTWSLRKNIENNFIFNLRKM